MGFSLKGKTRISTLGERILRLETAMSHPPEYILHPMTSFYSLIDISSGQERASVRLMVQINPKKTEDTKGGD